MSTIRVQGLVLGLCLIIMACADEKLPVVELYPYQGSTGHWGYMNKKGEVKIEPQYDFAYPFQKDTKCARVKLNGKFGIVDVIGKYLVPPTIDSIGAFEWDASGFVRPAAMINNVNNVRRRKWGFVDVNGVSLSPILDNKPYFRGKKGELAISVSNFSKYVIYKRNGERLNNESYQWVNYHLGAHLLSICQAEKWGLMDVNGTIIIEPVLARLNLVHNYSEPEKPFVEYENEQGLVGLMKIDGSIIIEPSYTNLGGIVRNGVLVATKNEKEGLINLDNEVIIPFEFDDVTVNRRDDDEGLIGVERDEKEGFFDYEGKLQVPLIYDYVSNFENGSSRVKVNGKFGFINSKGEYLLEPVYDWIDYQLIANRRRIVENGKYGFIDGGFNIVIPPERDFMSDYYLSSDDLAFAFFGSLTDKAHFGIVDIHGKSIFPSSIEVKSLYKGKWTPWDQLRASPNNFIMNHKGLMGLKMDGKWGIVNSKLELIHPPIFSKVEMSGLGGLFLVYYGDKKSYLSAEGDPIGFNKQDIFKEISRASGNRSRQIISDQLRHSNKSATKVCYRCGGDGSINCEEHDSNGDGFCTNCKNTGFEECYVCHGSGRVSN